MPVESVCIPCSHLPSACSFYLEVLTSFNYRFVEESDGKIGFGPNGDKADLYLHQRDFQESSTRANISFTAPSGAAIDSFAEAAPRAGGSVLSKPVLKDCEHGTYTATISDLDGNKITATCNDLTMSTASYPRAVATSRNDEDDAAEGPDRMRITIKTQTSEPAPSSDSNALLGTLLGVAAGVAVTYLVGKERKSSTPDPPQNQARQAIAYAPRHQISYPSTPQTRGSTPLGEAGDYFDAKPRLLRSATYHYEYSMPPSPESSPPSNRYISQSRAPSISEVQSVASRSSRHQPLMIEGAPAEYASIYRQILPPSPPSSVSSRSQRSLRRAESPSPVRSSHSKASSRRSHSVASSQRTIRPEQLALPASAATSHVSAPRSVASSNRSRHLHHSTKASSEASWHSAEQSTTSRKSSSVSRRTTDPADFALPESRRTSVVSKTPSRTPLPESRKTSVVSKTPTNATLPESREPSIISAGSFRTSASSDPRNRTLPPSRKSSVAPYEVELPLSEAGSRSSSSTLKAKKTSIASRHAHEYPLPASRQTSVASRVPENVPLPGSKAGSRVSSVSTLKPANPSASALAYQDDETESLAPSDSISQIGARKHRRKKHSESGSHHSGSHKDGKKRSVVSLPAPEPKKEKEQRGVASLLGF